jgi:tripartite-type tricarboxylate transporter receptor subunit TctC
MHIHHVLKTVLLGFAFACAVTAHAEYPSKPITVVVPFQAGGTSDALARVLAKQVSASLGKPIIIENKPGAEGLLGAQDVAKAAPDGYRIALVTNGNLSALPAMRKVPPYDPVTDFTPIAGIGRYAFFLYVHSSVPAKNFREFVEYAKANPGKMSYGSGNGTGVLTFAQLKSMFGIDLLHVPYKGEPSAIMDLSAGRLQAMIATAVALPYVKDGTLRMLVALLPNRSPLAPNVPVLREIGMGDLPVQIWAGIVGPAGLPKDIVERLNKEFVAAANKPEVRAQIEQMGFALMPARPEAFATMVKEQAGAYRKLVSTIGMPLE